MVSHICHILLSHDHMSQKDKEDSRIIILYHILIIHSIHALKNRLGLV